MDRPTHTLLAPGNEEAWTHINAAQRRDLTPAPETPVETLLQQGVALSEQAILLLRAVDRADEGRPAPSP
jgi:hypothetical protein